MSYQETMSLLMKFAYVAWLMAIGVFIGGNLERRAQDLRSVKKDPSFVLHRASEENSQGRDEHA